jgi:hypothetical protein
MVRREDVQKAIVQVVGNNEDILIQMLMDEAKARENLEKEIKEKSECYAKVCARLHERVIDLERELLELEQKLFSFKERLEKTEWRGISSELYEEFKERLGDLLKEKEAKLA